MRLLSRMKYKMKIKFLRMLGVPAYFQNLEKRVEALELEVGVLQNKIYSIQTNRVFFVQHNPLDAYEEDIARLEMIFNSSVDNFFTATWGGLKNGSAEHFRLAKSC